MTTQTVRFKQVNNKPILNAESKVTHSHFMNCSDERCKYSHALYLSFLKEDFPNFKYPSMKDAYYGTGKRFDYFECDFADLPFHGGITYYSERICPEMQKTIVKIGCDYQHYGDDHYSHDDNGDAILNIESEQVVKEFIEIHEKRTKENDKNDITSDDSTSTNPSA